MTYCTTWSDGTKHGPSDEEFAPDPEEPMGAGEWELIDTTAVSFGYDSFRLFWTWRKVEYEVVATGG